MFMYRVHFNVIISVQRHILSLNLTNFFFSVDITLLAIVFTVNQLFTQINYLRKSEVFPLHGDS